jgi:ferredoxin
VFTQLEDGIAYVVEDGVVLNDPGSAGSLANVHHKHMGAVVLAADVCPGECIFIDTADEDERLTFVGGATAIS